MVEPIRLARGAPAQFAPAATLHATLEDAAAADADFVDILTLRAPPMHCLSAARAGLHIIFRSRCDGRGRGGAGGRSRAYPKLFAVHENHRTGLVPGDHPRTPPSFSARCATCASSSTTRSSRPAVHGGRRAWGGSSMACISRTCSARCSASRTPSTHASMRERARARRKPGHVCEYADAPRFSISRGRPEACAGSALVIGDTARRGSKGA